MSHVPRLFADVVVFLAFSVVVGCRHPPPPPDPVAPNDNRVPAGVLRDGVLTLSLEIRSGRWNPEGPAGVGIVAPVFSEKTQPPLAPGPLIRVPAGTRIALHLHNMLSSATVDVHGLHDRPGHTDESIALAPGAARDLTFSAGPPGTYFYWGATKGGALKQRGYEGQLTGAFIVDPPGADARLAEDRVFVIGRWTPKGDPNPVPALKDKQVWVINGRSWPATERLTYPVNRPIRWRVINASHEGHPMHLHGTYYHVESLGTESDTTALAAADQPMVVTHLIREGQTMAIAWTPGQPGNWLFHCHILYHVDPLLRLTPEPAATTHEDHAPGAQHMAGLVLGVGVQPSPGATPMREPGKARPLTLLVGERPGVHFPSPENPGATWPGLGYRLVEAGRGKTAAPFTSPGPPIVLTRDESVAITVRNELPSATTVHWHGIELESYYDGVSGIGGSGRQITPQVPPGGTFVARFTPPRAGTFIYHTHLNDFEQLTTGLYGALIVMPPGERFEPAVDKVFVLSRGPDDEKDPVLINGTDKPGALDLSVGVTYRLRFIGITAAPDVKVSVRDGDRTLTWRPLAKDGAAFDRTRALTEARQTVSPGETCDFAFIPSATGVLRLLAEIGSKLRTEITLHVH